MSKIKINNHSLDREASAWLRPQTDTGQSRGQAFSQLSRSLLFSIFKFKTINTQYSPKKIQELKIKLIKARITTQHLSSNFYETFDTEDFLENRRYFIKMEEKRKL